MAGGFPHLAVELDGAGWHPAAWRLPAARPAKLLRAKYWLDLVREAEEGLLADELIVTTITHDHADRARSYELLAEEWGRRHRPARSRA